MIVTSQSNQLRTEWLSKELTVTTIINGRRRL